MYLKMKNKMMKIFLVFAAAVLLFPVDVFANDDDEGKISSKDEVVYATLSAQGDTEDVYVVNTFAIEKAGMFTDFGNYSSVKNLTDLSKVEQANNTVQFSADQGKFYYQGNLDKTALPWDITISYVLDGKDISPEELLGKDGKVQFRIETKQNEQIDPVFFENYLLQISLVLDGDHFSHIKAEDGVIANAGKSKQVTFTVMPEKEAAFIAEADVTDFEMEGIEITGLPSTMNIDAPDVDDMKSDMNTLTGAIAEVNDGVGELKKGIAELNQGASELYDGAGKYKNGIAELDGASAELVAGSKEIDNALNTISRSLGAVGDMDVNGLEQLSGGLNELSDGLKETAAGLAALKENYAQAYDALDGSMQSIPANGIAEADIAALYQSDADKEVIDQLIQYYKAAQTVKGTYEQVKQGFDAVDGTLEKVTGPLDEMADHLEVMADGLSSVDGLDGLVTLQEGMTRLASDYSTFHAGLAEYTDGVGQLTDSYQDVHDGIGALSDGTGELENGADALHKGTMDLHNSTKDLPKQMTEEIDEMMAEYDKSDFDAISFVSEKNEKVNTVQFVLKTESIKQDDPEPAEEPANEEKGFWEKLKDLFF